MFLKVINSIYDFGIKRGINNESDPFKEQLCNPEIEQIIKNILTQDLSPDEKFMFEKLYNLLFSDS